MNRLAASAKCVEMSDAAVNIQAGFDRLHSFSWSRAGVLASFG
jgi:hypothetical protein